jgi:hypothetical protein
VRRQLAQRLSLDHELVLEILVARTFVLHVGRDDKRRAKSRFELESRCKVDRATRARLIADEFLGKLVHGSTELPVHYGATLRGEQFTAP